MNKVFLIGNLTKDPELSQTPNGISVCKFSLAVSRNFSKDGKRDTDFFNIVVWRGAAENCAKYLKKGSKAAVSGSIQTGSYEKDGIKHYSFDIVASEIEFLSTKNDYERPSNTDDFPSDLTPVKDDDLPF